MQTRTPTKVLDPNGSNILVKNKKTRVSIFLIRSFVTTFVHKEQLHRNYFNEKKSTSTFSLVSGITTISTVEYACNYPKFPKTDKIGILHTGLTVKLTALRVLPLTGLLPEMPTSSQIFSLHFPQQSLLSISDRTKRNVQRCLFLIKTFAFLNTTASLPDYELHPI